MKKRIAILTVVIALVVAFAVVFTSCGIKDKINNLIPGGGDGDGNDGYNMASDHNSDEIEANLNRMAENGVFVKLRAYGESDGEAEEDIYYAYGVYGDTYYLMYGDEEDQIFVDLSSNDYMVSYTCDVNESGQVEWTKNIIHYTQGQTKEQAKTSATAGASLVWVQLGCYAQAGNAGSKTTASMLGRTCDKYVVSQSAASIYGAASIAYEYWIDQATGACLKYCISGSATTVDGSTSGSFGIEATNFDTNWRPQLPRVTKTIVDYEDEHQGDYTPAGGGQQGGQQGGTGETGEVDDGGASRPQGGGEGEGGGQVIGGEGEGEQETSEFINKRLEVTEVYTDNQYQALFENAHIDFYSNGHFEFVSELGVIIGTYEEVAQYHRVVLNAYLLYKDGAYSYTLPDGISGSMIVSGENPAYLWRIGEVEVEPDTYAVVSLYLAESQDSPEAADIPDDPNGRVAPGDFDNYQVTQEVWEGIFAGEWLFEEYGNFRVDYSITGGASPRYGLFMVDGDVINDDDIMMHVRQTFEKDEDGQYTFKEYYYVEGAWQYTGLGYFDLTDWWDQFTGAIPAPFMKSSYDSIGEYYYIDSFNYTPVGQSEVSITNFRAWFESGLLQKVQFTKNGETYVYEFSDYGSVDLEDPSV